MKQEQPVIQYEENKVILDQTRMVVGVQYPVIWRGKPAVAVKRTNGSVDFGTLPLTTSGTAPQI